MRNELQLIETIEQYLAGLMPPAEKTNFEDEIARDPNLAEQIQLQKDILAGLQRTSLKQQIRKAKTRYYRTQYLKWGATGLLAACIIFFLWHAGTPKTQPHQQTQSTGSSISPTQNRHDTTGDSVNNSDSDDSSNSSNSKYAAQSNPGKIIPAQIVELDSRRDTIINTQGGLTIAIPANAWIDAKGNPTEGIIQFTCKEALDAKAILMAGLSTRSGTQDLETAGMFLIEARKDGQPLDISPTNHIIVCRHTDSAKPYMQLYQGRRQKDNHIDWTNPQPLNHDLHPIDIHQLDFYPPGYLDSLASWRLDARNKNYTDSLYYSFASGLIQQQPPTASQLPKPKRIEFANTDTMATPRDSNISGPNNPEDLIHCGINPARIRAIWDDHIQNTLLATVEFGLRMPLIHQSGYHEILDLYVQHLDWPLYKIDSLAAEWLSGRENTVSLRERFRRMAMRHDGKLNNASHASQMLNANYLEKTRTFTAAIANAQQTYWSRQDELDKAYATRQNAYQLDSIAMQSRRLAEELDHNFTIAYAQLGITKPSNATAKRHTAATPPVIDDQTYQAEIKTTGWYNFDRLLTDATREGRTFDYQDPNSGRKAHIEYIAASFTVSKSGQYDRLNVYLLPMQFNSYLQLQDSAGAYRHSLNTTLRYRLVCIGYKARQAYFFTQTDIIPRDYGHIDLDPIDSIKLDQQLVAIGNNAQSSKLVKDNRFFRFDNNDLGRRKRNESIRKLQRRVRKLIFPCIMDEEDPAQSAPAPSMQ